jgi:hypothetical protein
MSGRSAPPPTPEEVSFYSRLEPVQVLSEYDGPVLFLAVDPAPTSQVLEQWLFTWRGGGIRSARSPALRGLSGVERWLAIPISDRRKAEILSEHISLREAILLPETEVYLLEGAEPLRPNSVSHVNPTTLDRTLIPSGDVSVFQNALSLPGAPVEPTALRVVIHVIPGPSGLESSTISAFAVIQECLQRFVSWTAREILSRERKPAPRPEGAIPVADWAALTLVGAAPGTLTIVAKTEVEGEGRKEAIISALRALEAISQGHVDEEAFRGLGARGTSALLVLLSIMRSHHLSVSLKWGSRGSEEFATIRETTAEGVYDVLQRFYAAEEIRPTQPWTADFIVHLTEAEAHDLLKEVDPQRGGFQALIAALQRNLQGQDLRLTPLLVERVIRYVQDYGEGSYENRLRPIFEAIQRYGISFVGLR